MNLSLIQSQNINLPLLCLFFLGYLIIAEFIGRSKHIGRGWTFILLANFIIPGLIALVLSPNAKKTPTQPSKFIRILGYILLGMALFLFLPSIIYNINIQYSTKWSINIFTALIFIGIYVVRLGQGKIQNHKPKLYFSKAFTKHRIGLFSLKSIPKLSNELVKNKYKYYYIIENEQPKHYTLEELIQKGISENELLWRKGLEEWTKASSIKELVPYLLYTPPQHPILENIEAVKIPETKDEISVSKPTQKKAPISGRQVFLKLKMHSKTFSIAILLTTLSITGLIIIFELLQPYNLNILAGTLIIVTGILLIIDIIYLTILIRVYLKNRIFLNRCIIFLYTKYIKIHFSKRSEVPLSIE